MNDSTLALGYDEIRRLVGEWRGYGETLAHWSGDSKAVSLVEGWLLTAARMVYNESGHDWSWMQPIASFVIPTGEVEVPLPNHFGYLIGKLYFETDAGLSPELRVENVARILKRRQQQDANTGQPQYAAIDQRAPGVEHGQRKYLIFWPIADADYTVTGQFQVLADGMSTSEPYPWGGTANAGLILQACLAAAEQRNGELGVQTAIYKEKLAAAIQYDRLVKPQSLSQQLNRPFLSGSYVTYTPGP